jgi:hypothetical protein
MVRSSSLPIGSSRDDQAGIESRAAADRVARPPREMIVYPSEKPVQEGTT